MAEAQTLTGGPGTLLGTPGDPGAGQGFGKLATNVLASGSQSFLVSTAEDFPSITGVSATAWSSGKDVSAAAALVVFAGADKPYRIEVQCSMDNSTWRGCDTATGAGVTAGGVKGNANSLYPFPAVEKWMRYRVVAADGTTVFTFGSAGSTVTQRGVPGTDGNPGEYISASSAGVPDQGAGTQGWLRTLSDRLGLQSGQTIAGMLYALASATYTTVLGQIKTNTDAISTATQSTASNTTNIDSHIVTGNTTLTGIKTGTDNLDGVLKVLNGTTDHTPLREGGNNLMNHLNSLSGNTSAAAPSTANYGGANRTLIQTTATLLKMLRGPQPDGSGDYYNVFYNGSADLITTLVNIQNLQDLLFRKLAPTQRVILQAGAVTPTSTNGYIYNGKGRVFGLQFFNGLTTGTLYLRDGGAGGQAWRVDGNAAFTAGSSYFFPGGLPFGTSIYLDWNSVPVSTTVWFVFSTVVDTSGSYNY